MTRPFSVKEAKRIIDEHKELKRKLNDATESSVKFRSKITDASNDLAAQEVFKILEDIPVEELNRDKKGFRIKALRDYGYNTIADVSAASVYTLSSVHGISEDIMV